MMLHNATPFSIHISIARVVAINTEPLIDVSIKRFEIDNGILQLDEALLLVHNYCKLHGYELLKLSGSISINHEFDVD
jgi:hypothetical protein